MEKVTSRTTVRDFLQTIKKGEGNQHHYDVTCRTLRKLNYNTVGELQTVDDNTWNTLPIPPDIKQKMRDNLRTFPDLKTKFKPFQNQISQVPIRTEIEQKREDQKGFDRASHLSSQIECLSSEKQKEERRLLLSVIENCKTEHSHLDEHSVQNILNIANRMKQERELLFRDNLSSPSQTKAIEERKLIEQDLEKDKRTNKISISLHSKEARLAICWLEWLEDLKLPASKARYYAIVFAMNNLLPSRVVELEPKDLSKFGVDNKDVCLILAKCLLSLAVIKMDVTCTNAEEVV
eukprot:TRINITY_DN10103_c0_g1_i1.p1 TRINITY_DN10103_c0_g1~~TRINITY_DN10103_c0_g1_i1.p1  ORF type:complete len:292 (-),score=58.18 TRINITY_DN10103_c0_g1_i1:253-1128(-)